MTSDQNDEPEVVLYADFHLLDRQVIDSDGMLVCKIDDLELSESGSDSALPCVTNVLVGPAALGPRIGGILGDWFVAAQRRFHPDPDPGPASFPFALVEKVHEEVRLSVSKYGLDLDRTEDWVRDHLIGRIPGADERGSDDESR
ncbi:hypothetical protein [Tenggerimyces flavus]|uniref:Uncharacterized protein n=1 Tax=Tenggerimyces flavus TaxID=1708749 RepID=A0ABV7Y4Z2_9ACTN|nr:hypothetical protein [Tenggerimyces flavus]MBM7790355.1 hypothetical protein [Tenggerimyces flavus]